MRRTTVAGRRTAVGIRATDNTGPAGYCRPEFLDACSQVIKDVAQTPKMKTALLALIASERKRKLASVATKLTLPETPLLTRFELSKKLSRQVQYAARELGCVPEWVVSEALDSFCTSIDRTFLGDMRSNYLIAVNNGEACGVTALEGGVL